MTKADKIRYILKYQDDINPEFMDDFQKYTKVELEEMSAREVTTAFSDLMQAEDIMDNIYQSEYIRYEEVGNT